MKRSTGIRVLAVSLVLAALALATVSFAAATVSLLAGIALLFLAMPRVKPKSPDPVYDAFNRVKPFCPECRGETFLFGPHGGEARAVECEGCGAVFTIAPMDDVIQLPLFFARRNGWNDSGRWSVPGQLKDEASSFKVH